MQLRTLGRSGLKVSEIGFGSWGIGKSLWTDSDDAQSLAALRRALELGINFFDTAYVYGDGHSEALIARAFKEFGRGAMVATKVPPKNGKWPSAGPLQEAFPGDWIVRCTERSLKQLRAEQVELQQLHVWQDAWMDSAAFDDARTAMERLTRQGKVRFWGVSIDSRKPNSALRIAASGAIDTVQVIFNLFEQEPLDKLFPLCVEKKIGVIVRVPFDEGGLTGALREDTRFDPDDFRSSYFSGGLLAETVRRAKRLESALVDGDKAPNLAYAALRYCLSFPAVSTVIPGMRKASHVEANVRVSGEPPYPAETLEALREHAWKRNLS